MVGIKEHCGDGTVCYEFGSESKRWGRLPVVAFPPETQEEAVFAAVSSWHSRNCCHSSCVFIIKISLNSRLQPQWIHKEGAKPQHSMTSSCQGEKDANQALSKRQTFAARLGPVWGSGVGAMARARAQWNLRARVQSTIKALSNLSSNFIGNFIFWIESFSNSQIP